MTLTDPILAGKTALITGGGRGIGAGLARAFAREGALVFCAGRTAEDLDRTTQAIRVDGGHAVGLVADVTDLSALTAVYDKIAEDCGALDIVVANAGLIPDYEEQPLATPELWRQTIEVNLFGVYNTILLALPLLRKSRGRIIVVGSGAGHQAVRRVSSYCCSKAAAWMLVRSLSEELRADGISINELVPGPVITERKRDLPNVKEVPFLSSEWIKQPDDVAPLALFLASQPEGAGPTGQSFSLSRR